ncbi:putative transporter svop-1 [Cochliomyia hominivorax]
MSFNNKDLSANESQLHSNTIDNKVNQTEMKSKEGNDSSDTEKKFLYEDVLELIGFGITQWLMLLNCGLLLMMVINETMGMSIITIASQCDFDSSSMDKAIMSAAAFIGVLCSSYFWGYLSDTCGRKPILMYTTLLGNIVSLVSIFIANFWLFVFLRFLVGIFIAGASSTSYAYLGEFFIARHRPVAINYASMFVGVAMTYVPAVAWLVLSMDWSFEITHSFVLRPWRLLTIFNILPGFIAVLLMISLPDSPKILMSLGRKDEAYEAVNWIAKRNTGKSLQDLKVFKLMEETSLEAEKILYGSKSASKVLVQMWRETKPLFKRPHVLNFLISCIIMCGVFFCNSGMGLWYTEIQNRLGSNSGENQMTICQVIDAFMDQIARNETEKICDDTINTKSYIDSITFGLCYIVGYVILGLIINPLGRKLTIMSLLIISAICGLVLHWLLEPIAIVVCFILFLVLPGLCISVLSGAVVDLVPTNLRGKAVCICLMLGRSGSILGSNIIGILLESYCSITFGVFYGLIVVCAILTFMLPI